MTTEQMKEKLSTMLTEHRYTHSIGVMETSEKMARIFGTDTEKALIAGLLHDCAKQIDRGEQLKMCEERGIEIDDIKKSAPSLVHADLGASVAKTDFDVTDEDILSSIKYHTLGRKNMTVLEKILFLADIIEPNRRDFEGLAELRSLCEKDLDEAMLFGLNLSIKNVERKGRILHTQTIEARNYYENLLATREENK